MELRLSDVMNISNGIASIPADFVLPVMLSFKLVKLSEKIAPDVKGYQAARTAKIKELGVEKDGQFTVPEGKAEEFFEALNPLLQSTVEVDIDSLELKDFDGLPFNVISMLSPILKE